MVKDEPDAIDKALLPPEMVIRGVRAYAVPPAIVPLLTVVNEVADGVVTISLAVDPRLTTSPRMKSVVNEVPVPVTAVVVRAIVPAPAVVVPDEKVTAALLMISNCPMVSLVGILVTVAVAIELPSNTRISFAAGEVRAGDQLVDASRSPEATAQV